MPLVRRFGPSHGDQAGEDILMTVDEYEAVRLIDYLGYTQEECAAQMRVGRTTVTSIYASAREKIAGALVEGASLSIGGGVYKLCEEDDDSGCQRCRHAQGRGGGRRRRGEP